MNLLQKCQENTPDTIYNGKIGMICLGDINNLGLLWGQTLSTILGNGAVDNGTAIEACPGIEYEKEVRESLQQHRPFALWTFHRSLLG